MSTTVPPVAEIATRTFSPRRGVTGFLLALVGYAIVLGGAYLAGRTVKPGAGGFDDLAAVAIVLVLGTGLVTLACLITGIVLIVRGRRDVGAGLLIGLLVGCAAVVAVSAGWTVF
jgi:uncharacterized membrane protein YhaH (DUF805 family)